MEIRNYSLILSTATRAILPLMLVFSVFLLLRGHNEPGGGFVGGLVAAASFALYSFSFGVDEAQRALRVEPRNLIGVGLLIAVCSGFFGLFQNKPFMKGVWLNDPLPVLGKVGTPVLFDLGVYLVVIGITLTIIFSLAEAEVESE